MIEVEIKKISEIHLVCVRGLIRDGAKFNRQIIPELWAKLSSLSADLPALDANRYALITGDLNGSEEQEAFYFAGIRVDPKYSESLPEGLFRYVIQAGEVATTFHVGPPTTLSKTSLMLFRDWLPSSNFVVRINQELIVYPPDYKRDDPHAKFEYTVFVRQ